MVKFQINFEQIKKAAKKLPVEQRIKLVEELERDTWEIRFKKMFNRINTRFKKQPISNQEIVKICKETRKELHHAKRSH